MTGDRAAPLRPAGGLGRTVVTGRLCGPDGPGGLRVGAATSGLPGVERSAQVWASSGLQADLY